MKYFPNKNYEDYACEYISVAWEYIERDDGKSSVDRFVLMDHDMMILDLYYQEYSPQEDPNKWLVEYEGYCQSQEDQSNCDWKWSRSSHEEATKHRSLCSTKRKKHQKDYKTWVSKVLWQPSDQYKLHKHKRAEPTEQGGLQESYEDASYYYEDIDALDEFYCVIDEFHEEQWEDFLDDDNNFNIYNQINKQQLDDDWEIYDLYDL